MQTSLSWIEWLDRLDRVLKGAREDVRDAVAARPAGAEGLAGGDRGLASGRGVHLHGGERENDRGDHQFHRDRPAQPPHGRLPAGAG